MIQCSYHTSLNDSQQAEFKKPEFNQTWIMIVLCAMRAIWGCIPISQGAIMLNWCDLGTVT